MFLLKQILPAVLLAIAVAAVGSGLAWWFGPKRVREAFLPLALAFGYAAGHFFMTGFTSFPPTDTTNWLPYFGVAAAGLGAIWAAFPKVAVGWITLALLAVAALRLLLAPKFRYGWELGQGWFWVIGLALGVVLLGVILKALVRRSAAAIEIPLILLLVSAGTSGALMLSGSILLGQFGAVLAGAILGALVCTLRLPAGIEGITPVVTMFLGLLLVSGYFFAELPATSALLLAAAPVLGLIPTGRLSRLSAAAAIVILVSLPVAAGVIVALRASPPLDY